MNRIVIYPLAFLLVVMFLTSGCISQDNSGVDNAKDCSYYCAQEGYEAVNNSCISFADCGESYTPVPADICEGLELCCCG